MLVYTADLVPDKDSRLTSDFESPWSPHPSPHGVIGDSSPLITRTFPRHPADDDRIHQIPILGRGIEQMDGYGLGNGLGISLSTGERNNDNWLGEGRPPSMHNETFDNIHSNQSNAQYHPSIPVPHHHGTNENISSLNSMIPPYPERGMTIKDQIGGHLQAVVNLLGPLTDGSAEVSNLRSENEFLRQALAQTYLQAQLQNSQGISLAPVAIALLDGNYLKESLVPQHQQSQNIVQNLTNIMRSYLPRQTDTSKQPILIYVFHNAPQTGAHGQDIDDCEKTFLQEFQSAGCPVTGESAIWLTPDDQVIKHDTPIEECNRMMQKQAKVYANIPIHLFIGYRPHVYREMFVSNEQRSASIHILTGNPDQFDSKIRAHPVYFPCLAGQHPTQTAGNNHDPNPNQDIPSSPSGSGSSPNPSPSTNNVSPIQPLRTLQLKTSPPSTPELIVTLPSPSSESETESVIETLSQPTIKSEESQKGKGNCSSKTGDEWTRAGAKKVKKHGWKKEGKWKKIDKEDAKFVRSLEPRPCHTHFLSPQGCRNLETCEYGHDYELTEHQVEEVRRLAKEIVCPFVKAHACKNSEEECIYGHYCPRTERCGFGDACRFLSVPNGHGEAGFVDRATPNRDIALNTTESAGISWKIKKKKGKKSERLVDPDEEDEEDW